MCGKIILNLIREIEKTNEKLWAENTIKLNSETFSNIYSTKRNEACVKNRFKKFKCLKLIFIVAIQYAKNSFKYTVMIELKTQHLKRVAYYCNLNCEG